MPSGGGEIIIITLTHLLRAFQPAKPSRGCSSREAHLPLEEVGWARGLCAFHTGGDFSAPGGSWLIWGRKSGQGGSSHPGLLMSLSPSLWILSLLVAVTPLSHH